MVNLDDIIKDCPRVYNIKIDKGIPSDAINIMRPSKWGNPFQLGTHGNRDTVLVLYENYIMNNPELIALAKKELKGKDLKCCCHPKKCHGHVLVRIANEP